jgi:hypothetical protein
MSLFNVLQLETSPKCNRCGESPSRFISFRYGHVRQVTYRIGDRIRWDDTRNDIGDSALRCVEAFGLDMGCDRCGLDSDATYRVRIVNGVIEGVRLTDEDWRHQPDFRVCAEG